MAKNDVDAQSKQVKESQAAAQAAAAKLTKSLELLKKANASAKNAKKELGGESDDE